MASAYEVMGKADALCAALQEKIDDWAFDTYRDFLDGLQQQVVSSRESLSARYPDGSEDIGNRAAARLDSAVATTTAATADDGDMSNVEARCNAAIAAMDAS